jgi:hypothetical protein
MVPRLDAASRLRLKARSGRPVLVDCDRLLIERRFAPWQAHFLTSPDLGPDSSHSVRATGLSLFRPRAVW